MAQMSADDAKRIAEYYRNINDELEKQKNSLNNINIINQQISNNQKVVNELEKEYLKGNKSVKTELDKINAEQLKLINKEKDVNTHLENQIKKRQRNVDLAKQLGQQIKNGWKYLQEQDKFIKSTNLSLGLSGTKAVAMRDAFEQSAGYVARLGGGLGDIQNIMQGYADETGRARVMSAQMVEDITNIGKGTGLGIEGATKLGAQFELMGYDARTTMDYVQGVVDTSERMGVNTTKVLKNVSDNFKRLSTYTFKKGVQGFADMAMFAEKFKVDINQALNTVDIAKTLEGSIDMAAQLQVMGGEFAKSNPFEMMYLARNEPEKMVEKITDMTKGLVTFRKMADGSFEKFISPADRDRIAAVAKSMGMEASALTDITYRQAEIQKMRNDMRGMGLSDEQKKLIEGAAIFDKKSGKFQVQIAGQMKNIAELTSKQAKAFETEQVLLKDRAEQAMTFDETFKATINSLKTALLPLLHGINGALNKAKPIFDKLSEISGKDGGLWKAGGVLLAGAAGLKTAAFLLSKAGTNWVQTGNLLKGTGGKTATSGIRGFLSKASPVTTPTGSISGLVEQRRGIGAGAAAKGVGMKRLGSGAGIGAAAIGMGAGVGIAAAGISKLADSMSKLTPEQAESLQKIATTLAITFPVAAVGVGALAAVAAPAAVPLLAIGGAILMIGGGVSLATMGIGKMASGLAELNESGGGAGKELFGVAGGIGAITVAMGAGGLLGVSAFNRQLKKINKNSDGIEKVGTAFGNIQAVLSGSKDDFIAVENAVKSIAGTNIKSGGIFSELANLLKNPLQVEFKDKNLAVVSNITMEIDGKKLFNQTYSPTGAIQKYENTRNNKGDRM